MTVGSRFDRYYLADAPWLESQPTSLDTYDEQAATYDQEYRHFSSDLPFWLEMSKRVSGNILEIGCGTGRITLALAKAGCNVTGVDKSQGMLEVAKAKARDADMPEDARLAWICCDMRALHLEDETFDLVLVPLGVLNYMVSVTDQMLAASEISRVTKDRGQVLVELHNFKVGSGFWKGPRPMSIEGVVDLPDGLLVRYGQQTHLSSGWHTSEYVEIVDRMQDSRIAERRLYRHRWHLFTLLEVCYLFMLHGFRVDGVYGSDDRAAFRPDAPRMILDMTRHERRGNKGM